MVVALRTLHRVRDTEEALLEKVERIHLIQRLRDALGEVSFDDQNLILDTYGIGTVPEDAFGNGPTVTEWLRQSDDQDLIALAQHFEMLDNAVEYVADQPAAGEPAPLFIFATHLSKYRAFLGEVGTGLAQFGVTLFVAHDSIPVDAPWEKEIVDALNRCHAGAAFIHPGLYDSHYCMQETGWMLGRGIPIARLMFGDSPKGLLGEKQGKQLAGRSAMEVAAAIMDWSLTHPVLYSQVAASLTIALGDSESYATTDAIWDRLRKVQTLSNEQMRRVVHAAEANSQVFGANAGGWGGTPYRKAIGERVVEWGAQDALADRGMRLRKDTKRGYISAIDDVHEE